jgi:hypothetical protein
VYITELLAGNVNQLQDDYSQEIYEATLSTISDEEMKTPLSRNI